MNLNEMCTSVSYDIPIITVVMNNNVLGMIRQWQTTFYQKKYISSDLYRKTDYVKLAEAFGGASDSAAARWRSLSRRWPRPSPSTAPASLSVRLIRMKRCCP